MDSELTRKRLDVIHFMLWDIRPDRTPEQDFAWRSGLESRIVSLQHQTERTFTNAACSNQAD
jgi:hypothetical protein